MKTTAITYVFALLLILFSGYSKEYPKVSEENQSADLTANEFAHAQREIEETLVDICTAIQEKDAEKLISFHAYGPKFTEFKNGARRTGSVENETAERGLVAAISGFEYDLNMKKGDNSIIDKAGFRSSIIPKNQILNMPGTYKMISKTVSDGKTDSVVDGIYQLKIYTDDFFMYAAAHDSIASFSIGSYSREGTTLTERVLFSASGTNIIEPSNFILHLNKTPEGYQQIFRDTTKFQNRMLTYTENYKYVGNKAKYPIDGAWKQLENYVVKNKDTIWDNSTNFKVCYDGYFIWGAFHLNPATQKHEVFMGYGTIEMEGNNKLRDIYLKSNLPIDEGYTFHIDVVFRNRDEFKQTILDSVTGNRYVEVFQRLKSNKD